MDTINSRPLGELSQFRKRGFREADVILSQNENWMTPLELLLETMNMDSGDDKVDLGTRLDCAKAAAPYVHAKLSTVTNINPNDKLDAEIKRKFLESLSRDQDGGPPPPMGE
jgi:hypothetical protein